MGKGKEYALGLAQAYSEEKRKMMQLESKLGLCKLILEC